MLSAIRSFKPRQSFLEMTNAQAGRSAPTAGPKRKAMSSTQQAQEAEQKVAFRDQQSYLNYRPALDTPDGHLSFGRLASNGIFDSAKDEPLRVGMMLSSKLKRQQKSKAGNKGVKMVKTEFGTSVPASFKAGTYDKWCAKTRMSIPKPGEAESQDLVQRAKAIVAGGQEKRRYRKAIPAKKGGPASKGFSAKGPGKKGVSKK